MHFVTTMRQTVRFGRRAPETGERQSTDPGRGESGDKMLSRISSALARALLVFAVVLIPAVLLPQTRSDTALIVALVGLAAAAFTFLEYYGRSPSLLEFRDAPPFNRMRICGLALTVLVLTLVLRNGMAPTTLTRLVTVIGGDLGRAIDFPFSPVRLIVLMMPEGISPKALETLRTAAGLSYLISLCMLGLFFAVMKFGDWPARGGVFNFWINLPTIDPTHGDVVARLRRDAQLNLVGGFLLPFLVPAFVQLAWAILPASLLSDPHTLILSLTAWAFLPASLLMRGIALGRVADMISAQRRSAPERTLAAA